MRVKIRPRVTSVGDSLKTNKNKKRTYISRVWSICTISRLRVRPVHVINCSKFYLFWPFTQECNVAVKNAGTSVPPW